MTDGLTKMIMGFVDFIVKRQDLNELKFVLNISIFNITTSRQKCQTYGCTEHW